MSFQLYLKAFVTDGHPCPSVCLVNVDDEVVQRLKTLSNMAREFSLERIGDQFHALWGEPAWEAQFMLAAPQLFATQTQCWWTVEVITDSGEATLYTERVDIDRLIQACLACTDNVLYYTEDDRESVQARLARFDIGVNET